MNQQAITGSFSARLAEGQEGEHIVATILTKLGFTVMGTYQSNELPTAPKIFSGSVSLTAPDLMFWKDGKPYFGEVKRKNQWCRFNGVETGFNLSHYHDYKAISDSAKVPCFLFFIQEKEEPTGIFWTEIHNAHTRSWDGRTPSGKYIGKPEVFFTSESLSRLE